MARYTGPKLKLARREGCDLNLKSARRSLLSKVGKGSDTITKPGQHGKTSGARQSGYAAQLREKQKVRRMYGVLERQFRRYFAEAQREKGHTGEVLLDLLESRLDNVVYRMGFAMTRREARQLVNHAHFTVNGQKVNIPSYLVRVGDVIEVRESSRSSVAFKRLTGEDAPLVTVPQWLERDKNALKGTVTKLPAREDIDMPIEEHLIVELYSK